MPKKTDVPLGYVFTMRPYAGDLEILEDFYPTVKRGEIVRALIHNHVRKLLERASRQEINHAGNPLPTLDDEAGLDLGAVRPGPQ